MKQTGRFFIIFISLMVLWNTIFIKPIKLFTVFLHELGHAFMAVATGSRITELKIYFNESGHVTFASKGLAFSFFYCQWRIPGKCVFCNLHTAAKKYQVQKIHNWSYRYYLFGGNL